MSLILGRIAESTGIHELQMKPGCKISVPSSAALCSSPTLCHFIFIHSQTLWLHPHQPLLPSFSLRVLGSAALAERAQRAHRSLYLASSVESGLEQFYKCIYGSSKLKFI